MPLCGYFLYLCLVIIENTVMDTKKKLKRNIQNKMIAGVCSGLSDYLGIDITLVRILYLLLTIFSLGGVGVVLYILMIVIIPEC